MIPINYSVVIPHFNNYTLLNNCIESIPDRSDIEVIIIDDCSSKNIKNEIIMNYSRKQNIRIIFNTENKGAGYCRNIGIKESNGKWLLFADCDDSFSKNAFLFFDKYVAKNYDIVYFSYKIKNLAQIKKIQKTNKHELMCYMENKDKKKLVTTHWEPWAKMFSSFFIKSNDIFFHEVSVMNDAYFSVKAGILSKLITVSLEESYVYNIYSQSISRQISSEKNLIRINEILEINKLIISKKNYLLNTIDVMIPMLKFIKNFDFNEIMKLKRTIDAVGLNLGIPYYSIKEKIISNILRI